MIEGDTGFSDTALVALGAASSLRVRVLLLCESAPRTPSELAAQLGSKRQTMLYHLRALERAGLVAEAGREAISGGLLVSYRATRSGWAEVVAVANRVAGDGTPAP